jgi:hypothetical protein
MATQTHFNDLILTIPSSLSFGKTWGEWSIRFCLEKLKTKYYTDGPSIDYDGYIAVRAAADPSWQNRIENEDVVKTHLMNSNYTDEEIAGVMLRSNGIEEALKTLPVDLHLEDEVSQLHWHNLNSLFRSFMVPYVKLAKTTKVLCMKRPLLIPMLDSYVMKFLFEDEKGNDEAASILGMKQFRALMLHDGNLVSANLLTTEINRWLAERVNEGVPPVLSPIRVIENLLWFDWCGYKCFPEWECADNVVRLRR